VKLIERYDEWWSGFSSLFNLEKSPVPSLCYFGEWWGRIYGNRVPRGTQVKKKILGTSELEN
jgi:hypothetical protein